MVSKGQLASDTAGDSNQSIKRLHYADMAFGNSTLCAGALKLKPQAASGLGLSPLSCSEHSGKNGSKGHDGTVWFVSCVDAVSNSQTILSGLWNRFQVPHPCSIHDAEAASRTACREGKTNMTEHRCS